MANKPSDDQKPGNPNLSRVAAFLLTRGYKTRIDTAEESETLVAYKKDQPDAMVFVRVPDALPGAFSLSAIVEVVEGDMVGACISAANMVNAHGFGTKFFVTPNAPVEEEAEEDAEDPVEAVVVVAVASVCASVESFLEVFETCHEMLEESIDDYDVLLDEMLGGDGDGDEEEYEGDEEDDEEE